MFFFFQAEDGIRDLVRSRGLGDVYKRQHQPGSGDRREFRVVHGALGRRIAADRDHPAAYRAVSYTHLTLPTSDLV